MLLTLSPSQVDEDLMCQICLQPFVSPTDTPCSHTFCQVSIIRSARVVNITIPDGVWMSLRPEAQ